MAGIEKVCECPKNDCEYHAGLMYKYKHNNLQINPECRYQFKGLTAKCAIVMSENFSDEFQKMWKNKSDLNNDILLTAKGSKRVLGTSLVKLSEVFKENGYMFHEDFWYVGRDKLKNKIYFYDPIKFEQRVTILVYVEEHNTYYLNWLYSKKSIRAFKRNMRKLFGYNIPMLINLNYKQDICPEDLAEKLIEKI